MFLTTISLVARENPFAFIETAGTTGKATYKKDTRENFSQEQFSLPSTARILKTIEFSFQNLDGSIETKSINVDKKIDWHDALVIKKLNEVEENIQAPVDTVIPKVVQKKKTEINFKNIALFTVSDKEFHVKTTDNKIRDFMVTNPYKVVLDFKNDIAFYTKNYALKTKYYKSITVGNHDGYYRVAIELDGKYQYDLQKVEDGYLINLK